MTNDNNPTDLAIQELRGENEALRRALLEVIQTLPAARQEFIKERIGAFASDGGEIGNPQRGAYHDTMDWFVRHIGR